MEALDAIVVGGGHNGLVAGAYLARAGHAHRGPRSARQHRWRGDDGDAVGPRLQGDGALVRHEPHAADDHQRPPTRTARVRRDPDGTVVHRVPRRPVDAARTKSRTATTKRSRSSRSHDADRLGDYDAWMHGVADVLASAPAAGRRRALGSHRPADLLEQLRLAWGMRGLDVRSTGDATRLFTSSIRDLLDRWFESPEVKGGHGDQRHHRHVGRARTSPAPRT